MSHISTGFLQGVQIVSGALLAAALGTLVAISTDSKPNRTMTFVIFAALAVLFTLLIVLTTTVIGRRNRGGAMSDGGDHIEQHIEGDVIHSEVVGKKIEIYAPQAGVQADLAFANQKQEDGRYLTRTVVNLTSRHAASALQAQAKGSSIVHIDAQPEPFETQWGVEWGINPEGKAAVVKVGTPLAPTYHLDVFTSQPDDLDIRVGLDTR